jgi:hypothetical protein
MELVNYIGRKYKNNVVIVSSLGYLIQWLSNYSVDVIDLIDFARLYDIDELSANHLIKSMMIYLNSNKTILFVSTWFEYTKFNRNNRFKNDFSFFYNYIKLYFNLKLIENINVPFGQVYLVTSLKNNINLTNIDFHQLMTK